MDQRRSACSALRRCKYGVRVLSTPYMKPLPPPTCNWDGTTNPVTSPFARRPNEVAREVARE